MSVVSVNARSFILALFIRDDGERFLLGDKGYDFKDSQLHFAANTIENDEVVKQGTDGVMVAGQVRRSSVQSFDGFVGDATMAKETIEQMRRDFFAFFVKGHHFRVVYIDCNRNAWQRKGGYLVDAPEVKELWQIHPEYHVGLNFEDVNYYSYDEDASGEEILSNLVDVPVSTAASGGLVWDDDGAVSEDAEIEYITETAEASGRSISISDAAEAPLASFQLDGETSQNGTPTPSAPVPVNTVTGENVVKICGKNLFDEQLRAGDISNPFANPTIRLCSTQNLYLYPGTYTFSSNIASPMRYALGVNSVSAPPTGTYPTYIYDSGWTVGTGSNTTTFTINQGGYFSVQLSKVNNAELTTSEAQAYHYQLELGNQPTAYEPYQGQNYTIGLFGSKNIFDKDNANIYNGYMGDNSITAAANARSLYIPVSAGQTYTFTRANNNNQVSDFGYCFLAGEPQNGRAYVDGRHVLGSSVLTFTTTVPVGAKFMLVYFAWNPSAEQLAAILSGYQIEYGSTSSAYEVYQGIELCKIGTYQDYIYKSDDKWYKHAEVAKIACAGISWTWDSTVPRLSYNASSLGAAGPSDVNTAWLAYSNKFKAYSFNYVYTQKNTGMAYSSSGFISLADTTWADAESAVASVQDCSIYYALATPTDTEITNAALITQLEAVLAARTYAGTNNITTITPNEQGTLEISYYTEYQPVVVGGGYVWEAGGTGGATVVVNNSIDNVSPIWKIYGPTLNPQLENSTTGETIEYVGMVGEGQTLTIDMGEQTASLDGLNVISDLVGDFISLAPGANRLIYSVTGDAGASEIGWSEIVG